MKNVAFKAGDTIIREGDEGDTAYFIVSGAVDVAVGQGAKARIVGRLETGEVFGEMCLIEPGPRSATVIAACDTECLAVSYQDFIAGIEENPERAVGFMKTLVRRLRKMNELLESVSPGHTGFRAILLDCQPSGGSPEAAALSWTMLW
jgi:CRP/FNR family transcriptional regulator, cyclic AMP receptor protein